MALGASVEVDLVLHADDGFAVLHNLELEPETTGRGLVRETPAATLRTLRLRDNDGRPISDRVMLLEDLAALIARDGAHPEALLQLDYKEDAARPHPARRRHLRRARSPRWRATSSSRPATPRRCACSPPASPASASATTPATWAPSTA